VRTSEVGKIPDNEEYTLLVCNAPYFGRMPPTFQRDISPQFPSPKSKVSKKVRTSTKYPSTLKIEAILSSVTFANLY
jgi:hypothetical protein